MRTGSIAAAIALLMAGAAPAARPIVPADIARMKAVADPQVDAAGKWVAYTVTATDVAADRHVSHIWMTSWDGARTVQLTARPKESESTPRFSPDGHWLAFVSSRGSEHDEDELWLMDRAGGEARRLPGVAGSVVDIAWSPDSRSLALIVADPDPDEKANAGAEAAVPSPTRPGTPVSPGDSPADDAAASAGTGGKDDKRPMPIVIDRFQFKQDIDGYLGKQRQRLWLYDLAGQSARRVTTGDFDEVLPSWSPDGRRIAYTSNRSADPDRNYDFNVYVATVAPSPAEPLRLTRYEGGDDEADWESYAAWSPDGREIAYLQGGPVRLFSYGVRHLAVIASSGGVPRILTASLDRNVTHPLWSADGGTIRFTVEDDGMERIASVPARGGAVASIVAGDRVFATPAAGPKGGLALLLSTPAAPDEVYALEAGKLRQLSHQNDAWLREVTVAPVARTSFRSKDGTEVHGFVTTPLGAVAARPLPALLINHGGPQSQYDFGFQIQWQILANHGYAVIASNPRGGTGRGEAYASAIYAKWGSVDVQDALAAVDDAVARGIADKDRLGVGGWSYGGMLTDYVIASDQRFKAAVSGASIGNILAGYGTDQYIRDYEMELGRPWEHPDTWLAVSYPFYHNERIVTPTLFMAGDKDFNVPLQNSEQLYQALKSRGIDTELVVYPGEFHGFKRPSFLKDRMQRWLAWYDARLMPAVQAAR